MKNLKRRTATLLSCLAILLYATSPLWINYVAAASNNFSGSIQTSLADGATVNQNLYASKDDVYLNGGPQNTSSAGLPDGVYYYQVTNPNGQLLLSEDNAICRQVSVVNGVVAGAYNDPLCAAPHPNGTVNPANGSLPVKLMPFADTTNGGGEYKVYLIRQTSQTSIDANDPKKINFRTADTKTDNFKVGSAPTPTPTGDVETVTLSGKKFYDANVNALDDDNQVVAGVKIHIVLTAPDETVTTVDVTTDANGEWSLPNVVAGSTYVVSEILPFTCDTIANPGCNLVNYWVQTAPIADSQGFQGYAGTANTNVDGLDFGDVCFGPATGGLTLGYWSNKNGQKTMEITSATDEHRADFTVYPNAADNPAFPELGYGMSGDLNFLKRLNLKNSMLDKKTGNTLDFDPANYSAFRTWLLNGNAVNMAYMLSVQLSATSLDVRHRYLSDAQIVDATSLGLGYPTIGSCRISANTELNAPGGSATYSGSPLRQDQEILKDFLDGVNNNRLPFAHGTPCPVVYLPDPLPISPFEYQK